MSNETFSELSSPPPAAGFSPGQGCSMNGVFQLQTAYLCVWQSGYQPHHPHHPPPVPEPGTAVLLAAGLVAIYVMARRKLKNKSGD